MTEEELAAIRERHKREGCTPIFAEQEWIDAASDRRALLAEVDGLREENAELKQRARALRDDLHDEDMRRATVSGGRLDNWGF